MLTIERLRPDHGAALLAFEQANRAYDDRHRELLDAQAAATYGLTSLRAAAVVDNLGSRSVLERVGFVPTGEEVVLSGKPGLRYLLRLADLPPNEEPSNPVIFSGASQQHGRH